MKKQLVNLYAGPGAGKSTVAAAWYTYLKQQGHSAEMVREWVKQWAYEKRDIKRADQIFITANTINDHLQAMRAGIPILISDSPTRSGLLYSNTSDVYDAVGYMCQVFEEEREELGYEVLDVYLVRDAKRKYNKQGRWQTEEEATQLDGAIHNLLHGDYISVDYTQAINTQWQQEFFGRLLNDRR